MDSKLKRTTIALTIVTCVCIVAPVLYMNKDLLLEKIGQEKTETVTTSVGNSDMGKETVEGIETPGTEQKDSRFIGRDPDAWKSDSDFFDSEADTLAQRIMEEMMELSVSALSVEKDLRIRVLDYQGEVKEGEKFNISVTGPGGYFATFTDDDRDGVFYIDNLTSGEYDVVLSKIEGYTVPDAALKAPVKSHVDYSKIDDIALLIKEKTDAEAQIDDLMVASAEASADKKQNTSFGKDESVLYGIDISSVNGEIDWKKVYDSGIRFVFLRVGYRGAVSGDIISDKSFETNAKNAIRAGLDVGAYFFSQAKTEVEAVEEASACLELIKNVNLTYPIIFRADQAGGLGRADGIDAETRTKTALAFVKTIESEGISSGIYASSNWLKTNLDANVFKDYKIWMAEYKKIPTYEEYYDIWQYASKGTVSGVEGFVNLNISYINN